MSLIGRKPAGYLALFGPDGREIPARRKDLLAIEEQNFDTRLHRGVVDNRSGRYWLISDRPGHHAMLLEVLIFHYYPRTDDRWLVQYGIDGIARYPGFDLERAISLFSQPLSW